MKHSDHGSLHTEGPELPYVARSYTTSWYVVAEISAVDILKPKAKAWTERQRR